MFPVSPAEPTDKFSYEVGERTYRALPNIHEMVYTNGKAFLAIATVRTISAPNSAYSAAFDRLDGYAENYARDQYGVEIEVREESRDDSFAFSGHTGVKFVFGIYKDMVVGFPPFETAQIVKVAELGAIAWFCNVDFGSVAKLGGGSSCRSPLATRSIRLRPCALLRVVEDHHHVMLERAGVEP